VVRAINFAPPIESPGRDSRRPESLLKTERARLRSRTNPAGVPSFFLLLLTLSNFTHSPVDEEQELKSALKKDCVEHCRHCHRLENHYLAWRAFWFFGILRGFTAGLIHLGPYRCRCCGGYLWIRWCLLDPRYHYRRWKGLEIERKPQ